MNTNPNGPMTGKPLAGITRKVQRLLKTRQKAEQMIEKLIAILDEIDGEAELEPSGDEEPFAFAGLWEFSRLGGESVLSSTIIVGEPNPLVGGVHDRMPVMLMPEDYDRWLDPRMGVDELRAMLKPYDPDLMKAYEVSRAVNSVKNDTPECVAPVVAR